MKAPSIRSVPALVALVLTPLLGASQGCTAAVEPSPSGGPQGAEAEVAPAVTPKAPLRILRWRSPEERALAAEQSNARNLAATAHLTYYGGRIISNVQVVQVLYGTGSYLAQVSSTTAPSIASFYQQATNIANWDWLSEYNTTTGTHQTLGRGTFAGQFTITPSSANNGSTITDAKIQAELAAQIQAGHLPAPTQDAAGNNNTYYAIFFPHGKTITQGGSSSCVAGGFCAYHGTISSVGGHEVYYGIHPDMQSGSGCDTGCGTSTPFDNYTSVASHELTEAATDAEVGIATVVGAPLAWYDSTNGEIGDICNAQQGTVTGADGNTYTVQKEWSNSRGSCYSAASTTRPNDFSIAASPASLTVQDESSGSDTITTAITAGVAESVALSASGAPSGVTVSFSPSSVSSGGASTMTVTAGASAATGSYTITVTGTAASGSHATGVGLTVTPGTPPPNDFSVAVSPSSLTVAEGASATDTVTTAITAGAAETVTLSASGAPSGLTVAFSPASVTSGGSSTLTVTASATLAAGSYSITVTGTSGATSHSATLGVSVTSTISGAIVNGGFETGSLSGWTTKSGSTSVTRTSPHTGAFAAVLGLTTPTNGDSSITQTFTVPSGKTKLSFWYFVVCDDTVTYDWATATLHDTATTTTTTVLKKTCVASSGWKQVRATVIAGHRYTLTLTSHDDNYPGDPTYARYDDVTLN